MFKNVVEICTVRKILNEKRWWGRSGLGAGGEEETQREISEELGIPRSYVSRLEKRALMI